MYTDSPARVECAYPAGTIRWINVEIWFRTTSRPNFNYISTLFQRQMPTGYAVVRDTLRKVGGGTDADQYYKNMV